MAAPRNLNDIAAELYALTPAEFTAARNARAATLDDRVLAAQVRRLRKPLLAAWVSNLFARERAAELGQALELGEQLREAQEDLDARALQALSRDRRALVRSLASQAAELAAARGGSITASTVDAVAETLNAAMFDAGAAAAVASGRLIRPLESSGADEADLSDAVAGDLDPVARRAAPPDDEVGARRRRKEAERALRAAETRLRDAVRARDDLDRRRQRAADRVGELAERAERLRTDLERTSAEAATARERLAELEVDGAAAQTEVTEAEQAAATARARVEDA